MGTVFAIDSGGLKAEAEAAKHNKMRVFFGYAEKIGGRDGVLVSEGGQCVVLGWLRRRRRWRPGIQQACPLETSLDGVYKQKNRTL